MLDSLRTMPLPRWCWRIAYICAYLILLCYVCLVFFKSPGINHHFRSTLGDMVYGRAHTPYVARVLVPLTIRGMKGLIPDSLEARFKERMWANEKVRNLFANFKWNEENFSEFLICAGLVFLMFWGFAAAVRALFEEYYDAPLLFRRIVPLVALIGVPAFFKYTSYIYDPALLLLFTLALLCMQRHQFKLYLVVFILNCLNKETAILLPFLFALYFRPLVRLGSKHYWSLLIAQIVIFIAIKATLSKVFAANTGGLVENHLSYNMWWLQAGSSWAGYKEIPGLAAWVFLIILAGAFWEDKPVLLRWCLIMLVPLMGLTFFLGALDELRDYYEVYPALLILMLHTVACWCGVPLRPKLTIFA